MAFTKQDALALIAHAETAPLANMRHAAATSELLQRFANWYEESTAPAASPAPQIETPQFKEAYELALADSE